LLSGLNRDSKINIGLGPGSGFKMRPFHNVCRGQQGEIERIRPPPTNSKNRLKSFCEVGYVNLRPNIFSADKRISMDILVGVGLHAMMPSCINKICSFFKKRKCARKICIVFVTLSDLNETSNRAVTHTYKMDEN